MSTRILHDPQEQVAALYDSVTGVAFGDVFEGEAAYEEAERFLEWMARRNVDPRALYPKALSEARREFTDADAEARKPEGVPVRREG